MIFWDSSAIVAALVRERATPDIFPLLRSGEPPTVWWATLVECESAISRQERDGSLAVDDAASARAELERLEAMWMEILPTAGVKQRTRRLLRIHPLRAADALQLSAAVEAAESIPGDPSLVCLDQRLCEAARKEGFRVLP